ncbi:hypothetical protein JI739_04480 [Ramlibacter sp. AW1]|uniref:Uncharacterized protein n=1 Tax=Ramlibacter aurantiacus TaxID=2801330 RepID=A0A937D6A4_9BURK|nr:hypothetical protein [Ramlibacter aurantiacus]MBL0419601.1 hypothetical protein [Ramlibacter aurantiacus]
MRIPIVGLALGALSAACLAQEIELQRVSDSSLQQNYWSCLFDDEAGNAAGRRMDENILAFCAAVSRQLQDRSFGGDFGRLHEWTQANRARARAERMMGAPPRSR